MPASQWHKVYTASVATTPDALFDLLADMPNYGRWMPGRPRSAAPPTSTPVRSDWAAGTTTASPVSREGLVGTVTGTGAWRAGFPPRRPRCAGSGNGRRPRPYSLEQKNGRTTVTRWLVFDVSMP